MKLISLDYNSVNSLSGIATFNRNLYKIFGGNIKYITFYKGIPLYDFEEINLGIKPSLVFKIFNYLSNYRLSSYFISKELKKYKCDTLVVNSPSLIRYLPSNKKIILVQHQDFDVMINNRSNFGSMSACLSVLEKIDRFVLLSPQDLDFVSQMVPDKYHRKLFTIRHMYDRVNDNFDKSTKTFNRSLVMVGRLDLKQKRQDLAILAMKNLSNWTLSIYGDGPDHQKLEKMIKDNELSNVLLKGSSNNIEKELLNYDIHVMTSDFEGYPFTNIEAMSCGLPIVLRDTFTSAKDVIDGNGFLLKNEWDEEEYINALYKIEQNFYEYSSKSLEKSKKYSYEIIGRDWIDLIDSMNGLDRDFEAC